MNHKLVIVADCQNAIFFDAVGLKIHHKLKQIDLDSLGLKKTRDELRNGFHQHVSATSHFFDPDHDPKEIETIRFAEEIIHSLNKLYGNNNYYGEIILCAEPKILGELRKLIKSYPHLSQHITKEMHKNLIHSDVANLEKNIFA